MIESGEKTEEYRDSKPYWDKRLCRDYDAVTFVYGYTGRTMTYEVKGISRGFGNPDWGAPTDRSVYKIMLGKRLN